MAFSASCCGLVPLASSIAVRDEKAGAGSRRRRWSGRRGRHGRLPDSVEAWQSLRLPGSGRPIAITRRLWASMTTGRFVEYR